MSHKFAKMQAEPGGKERSNHLPVQLPQRLLQSWKSASSSLYFTFTLGNLCHFSKTNPSRHTVIEHR